MENMTFPGTLRPEFCLEVDFNEEIFVPNVYDMLLIQNFWDNLESESFRICLRPKAVISKKNNDDLAAIKKGEEIKKEIKEEIKKEIKEENDEPRRRDSKSNVGSTKNWLKYTKNVFGKK